jgi:hypothetical protein
MKRLIAPSESLAALYPDVAVQWHATKNKKTPDDYTHASHFEAWWQCPLFKTHVWKARIASRTTMLAGCPACARKAGKGGRAKATGGRRRSNVVQLDEARRERVARKKDEGEAG